LLPACGPSQADLDKAIGEYIKKNPKVIQDAVRASRPQPQPQLSLDERIKKAIDVPLNNAPTKGAENAKITIVEFSDFQCPFCGRVNPTIAQVLKDYEGKVRVAFRQHPLPFHKDAMSAAKASLAANEQGKFWEMHDKLFENQKDLSDDNIRKLAKEIGLNMKKFEDSWKSDKFNAQIEEDIKFAQTNQATGTPSFFINGVFLKGAQPIGGFKEVIDKLLGTPAQPQGQAAN
jgi:protein-disulfide isomerase